MLQSPSPALRERGWGEGPAFALFPARNTPHT